MKKISVVEMPKELPSRKRKEETNRLWEKPDDFDPREHRRKRDSGDGNDNDNGNDSGSSNLNDAAGRTWGKAKPTADTPQNAHLPPSQAWGGDGDRNITKSSLSIEEIAKQEVSDAAREEELGRAHDLQRSAHDLRQTERSEFPATSQFAKVTIHSKATDNAVKANVPSGRMLFDPKSGRMVEARTEIMRKGTGGKERHKGWLSREESRRCCCWAQNYTEAESN